MIAIWMFPEKLVYLDHPSLQAAWEKRRTSRHSLEAWRWVPDVTVSLVKDDKSRPGFWSFHQAYRNTYDPKLRRQLEIPIEGEPVKTNRGDYFTHKRKEGVTLKHLIDARMVRRKVLHVGYWQKILWLQTRDERVEIDEDYVRDDIEEGPDGREIPCQTSYQFGSAPAYVKNHRIFREDEGFERWLDREYIRKLQFGSNV